MCGLAGILNVSGITDADNAWVKYAVRMQSHRGPDFSSGRQCSATVALGHNRLSILDLDERSNQPFSIDGEYWLVFNGEIYNYRRLARKYDLQTTTESDTEVLWLLLVKLPLERVLKEINGMFAFGFFNRPEKTLILARDRFGIKPLHFLESTDGLLFSSEIRPIVSRSYKKFNSNALSEYLLFQAPLNEEMLIDGIQRLKPGQALRIDTESGDREFIQWYKPEFTQNTEDTNLKSVFEDAVKRRLISDVPIGAFLSGGIDSTAIVTAMRSVSNSDIHTFNVRFGDFETEDSDLAAETAHALGTDHTAIELSSSEILDMIPGLVNAMDVPSPDAINTGIVSAKTKEAGITVALSGVGGDEFFAGYPSFSRYRKLRKLGFLKPLIQISAEIMALTGGRSFKKSARMIRHRDDASMITALSRLLFLPEEVEYFGLEGKMPARSVTTSDFRGVSDAELFFYTIPLLLRDADQMSMQHALEVRVPFFDHLLVEFIRSGGDHYFTPTQVAKSYLIEAMKPEFPMHVANKPKTGFVLPMEKWIKNELKDFTMAGLESQNLRNSLKGYQPDKFWKKFVSGKLLWSQLWSLSVLGQWADQHEITL